MPKDLLYGLRMLLRSPGFTLIALLSLALGIGANSAIFAVIDRVLLHPIPYPDPDRLMMLFTSIPSQGLEEFATSIPDFRDWRAQSHSFEQMAAIQSTAANMTGTERPERIRIFEGSANVFSVFGMQPELGRGFTAGDEQTGRRIVVLEYAFWQRSFGGDRNVIGKTITLDGANHTIVGVLPKQFISFGGDLWRPIVFAPYWVNDRGSHNEIVVARLKPQVSLQTAKAEMDTIARRLERAYPDTNKGYGVKILPLSEVFVRNLRPALVVLFAAVAFVLLIACANVANLMLTRATGRRREVAVRVALGGTRARIIRQLLTESLLLSCVAGGAGLLVAQWGTSLLMNSLPAAVNPGVEISPLNGPVFLFTLSVSLLIGLLFGLAPALESSKFNLSESLREGGRAGTAGMARQRFRSAMAVAEVALSLVLLAGAGLLIESFVRLQQSNPGFRPDSILTMEMSLPDTSYPTDSQKAIFYDRLLAQVRALPGLREAALVSALPLQGHSNHNSFAIEGRPEIRNLAEQPIADKRMVSGDYFHVMGIQMLRGRAFTGADNESAQAVAIVDEATAKQYWPNEDPIGKRIHYFKAGGKADRWLIIVGVVASVKQSRIDEPASSSIYVPFAQSPDTELALAVRGPVTAGMVSGAVHAIDHDLPVGRVRTMQEIVDQSTGVQRFAAQLVGLFAAVALALAVIGTYGVVAYAVAQRTQEFGIRLALGASRADVLNLVLRRGLILSTAGITLGLVAAIAATRLMAGMLFEVQAGDPWILGSAAVILGAVAMFACYLPARRATKVDPMLALRYE